WIDPQVAETKVHQRPLLGIIDTDVGLDELLGFGTGNPHVEVAPGRVLCRPDQRRHGAGEKGSGFAATLYRYFAHALDVADARGMDVEVRLRVVRSGAHGESPDVRTSRRTRTDPERGGAQPRGGLRICVGHRQAGRRAREGCAANGLGHTEGSAGRPKTEA